MNNQHFSGEFDLVKTFENSQLWFQIIDCNGNVRFMNRYAQEYSGYSLEELKGSTLFWEKIFNKSETGLRLLNIYRNTISRGKNLKAKTTEIRTSSGETKHLLWSLNIIKDADGRNAGASIVAFDQTSQPPLSNKDVPGEQRYRRIFRNAPIGFFRSLPEGRFLEINNAFAAMLGYDDPAEVLRNVRDIGADVYFDPEFRSKLIGETISSGGVKSFETVFKNRQSQTFDVRINMSSRYDDEIQNYILEGTIENISDRREAETALHKNLVKYSTLFEKSPISIWETDFSAVKIALDQLNTETYGLKEYLSHHPGIIDKLKQKTKIIDVNPATLALFEAKSKNEFFTEPEQLSLQEASLVELESLVAIAGNQNSFEHEIILDTRPAGLKNIIVRWVAIPENQIPYSRVLVSMIDITEQRREQEALKKSKNQLTSLFSSMDDLVFIIDNEGKYQYVAPTRPELLISSAEKLQGKYLHDFMDKKITEKFLDAFAESQKTQKTQSLQYPLNINNKELCFEAKISPLTKNTVIVVARDITERSITEKVNTVMLSVARAVSTTDKLDELFELIRTEIATLIDTKNFFLALFDAETDTLSLPYFQDEKDDFDQMPAEKTLSSLVIKQKKSLLLRNPEIRELQEKGKINIVGSAASVWLGIPLMAEGNVLGLMVVQNYDNPDAIREEHQQLLEMIAPQISLSIKRKQSEQLLKASEKLLRESNQTKDRFFNIIAHDLKNPFNAIIGFSSLLSDEWNEFDDNDKISMISSIKTSSEGAYELLMNLLDWSRLHVGKIAFEPEFIDFTSLIRINFSLLKSIAAKKDIRLISNGFCDKMIWADPNMIKTVIRNLMTNAIKFTPENGEIEVYCYKNTTLPGMMCLAIKDSGVGIPEKELQCMFNLSQSQTTAGTEGEPGTGLGLVLCKEFIEKNKGKIWAESELGKGSTFHIALPVRPDKL